MTVDNESPVVSFVFSGPGEYEFYCKVTEEEHLIVTHTSSSGVSTRLTLTDDYTVSINAPPSIGGSIDVTTEVVTGGTIEILRSVPAVQQTAWSSEGFLNLDQLEKALDEIIMILQQHYTLISSSATMFNWRSNWETGISYVVRDMVEGPDESWYYCARDHLAGVFADDLASGAWALLINRADLVSLVEEAEAAQTAAEAASTAAQLAQTAAEEAAENIIDLWEDNPMSYDTGDLVAGSDGYTYRSIIDSNVGNDPIVDDGTNWTRLNGLPIITSADSGKTLRIDEDGKVVAETIAIPVVDSLHDIGNAGTSKTLNTASYDTFTFTCDQSTLDLSSTVIAIGRTITLVITGADNCIITWPTGIKWPGGSAPTFSSGTDRVVMQRISSTAIHASLAGAEYA